MATSDEIKERQKIQRFNLTNGGSVEVNGAESGNVYIEAFDEDNPLCGTVLEPTPAECDALIAAIGRALGRPATASPRYAPSDELRFIEPICAALAAAGATQEQTLDAITKAMQDYRAKAVKLALEQTRPMVVVLDGAAHGEQGATVPRAGVEAVRERFAKWVREEGGARNEYVEGMTVGIKDAILALDALLAAPTTPTEKG